LRERSRIIRQIADGMERHHAELSRLVVLERGTVASGAGQASQITMMYDAADLVLKTDFEEALPPQPFRNDLMSSLVLRQPVGVCGLFTTWNGPLAIAIRKIAPALAAGCTMVMKAAPYTPLTVLKLAQIMDETDLPKGVFNVVTGDGIDIGEELATNPMVDMVSFTGGVSIGKRIMELAAPTLKRVTLELGGKSANIILDDVDPDAVAISSASAICGSVGQQCSALTRVFVPPSLKNRVLDRMKATMEAQVLGDPTAPATTMGPLVREERRQAVERYIQAGKDEGATLVTGGSRPSHLSKGYYLQPTVFADVKNEMRIAQEEIFGPVVAVLDYNSVDEAIQMANDTVYGLQANIETRNIARAIEFAKRQRVGAISINGAMDSIRAPRGGMKQTGFGREVGKWALDDYLEYQVITWPVHA
jgi:acyl-CoA reductase-like NAD-dependent aldehyde dehydrogenase